MKLYNTLTRTLEPFTPIAPPAVTIYVCGPTVYDDPHIGHARSAYIFDVLRRYLTFKGYAVKCVRNVTDVDDKIIGKARQELGARGRGQGAGDLKATCAEVAQRYLKRYHEAMDRLGIQRPDIEPLATEHVLPNMTDFIGRLSMNGIAYEGADGVYFAVRKQPGYGKLSHRSLDELQAGARVEPGEGKQDPLDFALWKKAKPDEPSWNSPWGPGRPGWHIECSTMSTKYLGDAFDIHGGGVDLVFPHHENEIAQAEAVGKPFARCWVHNGLLTVNGEKMSKSLGNYLTLDQGLSTYPHPDYLKLFFLKAHYRAPIDYATQRMDEAKTNWQEFARFFQHYYQRKADAAVGSGASAEAVKAREQFRAAMDDDLNTPQAIAALFELVNAGQRLLEGGSRDGLSSARGVFETLIECGNVLGLFQQGMSEEPPETLRRIQALIGQRDAARKAKEFTRADEMRETLKREGYLLTDTAGGTLWRRAS